MQVSHHIIKYKMIISVSTGTGPGPGPLSRPTSMSRKILFLQLGLCGICSVVFLYFI